MPLCCWSRAGAFVVAGFPFAAVTAAGFAFGATVAGFFFGATAAAFASPAAGACDVKPPVRVLNLEAKSLSRTFRLLPPSLHYEHQGLPFSQCGPESSWLTTSLLALKH